MRSESATPTKSEDYQKEKGIKKLSAHTKERFAMNRNTFQG